MLTIFVSDCNRISQSFYDSVVNHLQFHQLTCSCGHSACLSIHGYYKRSVKFCGESVHLRICRVRCSECGATHALLLSSIVPYSRILLSDQQTVCHAWESDADPTSICDSNPAIDENNVKAILRNYRKHWREKLKSLRISLNPLPSLISDCFSYYSAAFMQVHRGHNQLFISTT